MEGNIETGVGAEGGGVGRWEGKNHGGGGVGGWRGGWGGEERLKGTEVLREYW